MSFIRKSTETYGKAKLLLRENEYYIESESKAVATTLLREPAIKVSRNHADGEGSRCPLIWLVGSEMGHHDDEAAHAVPHGLFGCVV